jgi:hypothetical protein
VNLDPLQSEAPSSAATTASVPPVLDDHDDGDDDDADASTPFHAGALETFSPKTLQRLTDASRLNGNFSGGGRKSNPIDEKRTLIIFDWDDTLFPTTALRDHWKPKCKTWFKTALPWRDKMTPQMRKLGQISSKVVKLAMALGAVVLCTNAQRPWLTHSANLFLSEMKPILTRKDKPLEVFYALETMPELAYDEGDSDEVMDEKAFYHYTEGKRRVMSQQVEKCFTDAHLSRNIISLGDGDFEREALREIRTIEQNRRRRSGEKVKIMLKTIKMLDDPTVDDLLNELQILHTWLPKVVNYEDNLDISMESDAEIRKYNEILKSVK